MQAQPKSVSRNTLNYLVDTVIFLAFLIVFNPHATGMAIHEWLGIAFAGGIMTHLLLHWQWVVGITQRFLSSATTSARVNYIVNMLFFINMVVVIFTGIMISEEALPALGITLGNSFIWKMVHTTASDVALGLLGVHVALHWRWIVNTTKRFFTRSNAQKPTVVLPRGVVQKGA
ncbi:MAG: DUF4405 domain-containing protein [Caldilineaceae bacterium]